MFLPNTKVVVLMFTELPERVALRWYREVRGTVNEDELVSSESQIP